MRNLNDCAALVIEQNAAVSGPGQAALVSSTSSFYDSHLKLGKGSYGSISLQIMKHRHMYSMKFSFVICLLVRKKTPGTLMG